MQAPLRNHYICVRPWGISGGQLFSQAVDGCTIQAIKHSIKIKLCLFASNLYNNEVEVVYICAIGIDSLHHEDKVVVVVWGNDRYLFHDIEWEKGWKVFFFVH